MTKNAKTSRLLRPDEEIEITDRLKLLNSVGKQIEATSRVCNIHVRPSYYDESKYRNSQKTINKYFSNVSMASSTGLILLLQIREILIPLLKTGKSRTVVDLYDRYTATAKYIKRCYETCIFDTNSEAWKYITLVRSMHQRVHKLMNSPECDSLVKYDNQVDDYVWVNQYDMALTQFAFIGLLIMRPDKCGAPGISDDEMGNVVYFWRLLSYQLGIEDRFNLFVYHDDMPKQRRLIDLIFEEFKCKLIAPRDQVGVEMSRGFMLAFEDFVTEATYNIIEHHWFEVISLSGNEKPEPYNGLGERWKLFRFKITRRLMKNEFLLHYINLMYKKKFEKFCAESDKIKKKLAKKYPNHDYHLGNQHLISQH
jgi:hypothetical protein